MGPVNPHAPACEPANQRVGLHSYAAGSDIRQRLEEHLAKPGRDLAEMCRNDPEWGLHVMTTRASMALDLLVPERSNEPYQTRMTFTRSEGKTPAPGTVLYEVPRWNWRIAVSHVISTTRNERSGERIADVLSVILHEDAGSPVPTTRNPSWGFWGTWISNRQAADVRAEDAWEAVFELYGAPGTTSRHNDGLRDLLDSRAGRHYADALTTAAPQTLEQLRARMEKLGRPDKWYQGHYGTPVH